jgi:hypothetical protein
VVNSGVELHDSILAGLEVLSGVALLAFRPAYLHKSVGRPGIDSGTGWVVDLDLRVMDASLSSTPPSLPADVRGGSLEIGGKRHDNVIVLPLPAETTLLLMLELDSGDLAIRGSNIVLELRSEPKYVEAFTGQEHGGVV